jgi:ribonuclease E
VSIEVMIDESFEGARMAVECSGPRPIAAPRAEIPAVEEEDELDIIDEVTADEEEDEEDEDDTVEISLEGEPREARGERERDGDDERHGRKRRRRRRGGRGRGRREGGDHPEAEEGAADAGEPSSVDEGDGEVVATVEPIEEAAPPLRSRRRRGGRKPAATEVEAEVQVEPDSSPMVERPVDEEPPIAQTAPADEPKPKRRRSKKAAAEADIAVPEPAPAKAPPAETAEAVAEAPSKPARKRRTKKGDAAPAEAEQPVPEAANSDTAEDDSGEPRRGGWWQRTFG